MRAWMNCLLQLGDLCSSAGQLSYCLDTLRGTGTLQQAQVRTWPLFSWLTGGPIAAISLRTPVEEAAPPLLTLSCVDL